ncbi:MAG: DNA internalization-related competence protein ComEC/Rec2, partial [Chloroflexi bacterium]|nr:DNA internalization-related competence protein ComEC/Rec2 [Chloroflexota bacterium]
GLCLLLLLGGALRYQSSIQPADNTSLQFYNDKGMVQVDGSISGPPEARKTSVEFKFSANSITVDNLTYRCCGNVLVHAPFYKQLRYGDKLRITGKLENPPQFNEFDYKHYLFNQGIYSIINYPRLEILENDNGFSPLSWIYDLRSRLADSLSACLPEPQGSLAQAILLGIRGNLPQALLQSFYATGTTHLIAISGLNLTIILGMMLPLTIRLFGRRNQVYIWLSLLFIWLYTILTGLPPTVVRATIMGSVFLIAELLGRQRNAVAAMSFAGAVMVAIEPRVLWDTSFQLSFLSMLGLVLISPYFIRMLNYGARSDAKSYMQPIKSVIVTTFAATAAAIIATFPITTLNFRTFSLVGAPATFFAMPSFPAIILTSMLTSFAGIIWQPAGIFFGWVAWLFLSYFELVVNLFSAIPVSYITNINLQPWQVAAYYSALGILLISAKNKQAVTGFLKQLYKKVQVIISAFRTMSLKPYIYWVLGLLIMANILLWTAYASTPDGKLHVDILDVGQGESILIRTPDGQNILVDTGPDSMSACKSLGEKLPFWDRKIDMVILTQMQEDHIAGSFELLRRYNVSKIALSPFHIDSALSHELLKTIQKTQVETVTLYEGKQMNLGHNVWITVLNPPQNLHKGTDDDANNNSIVLRLSWNDVSFLLTSDMGKDAERYLTAERADLHSDILKVGHHGSKGSTSDEFLAIVNPSAAVISCGAVNRFGHPNKEVTDRLEKWVGSSNVFITATRGTVEFTTDGHRLWRQVDNISK